MKPIEQRGLCRLQLRMPAWRAELQASTSPDFLALCEAYDLVCDAIDYWSRREPATIADEYRKLADALENEALVLALTPPVAATAKH